MNHLKNNSWYYTDDAGSFKWDNPSAINELYFPLCNELGLMSSITPILHGDIKTDQNHFLLLPVSVEDLHNSKAARNFWCYIENQGPWSATGNSAKAHSRRFNQQSTKRSVEAGLLWHKSIYEDTEVGLTSEILNFVPTEDTVELMVVTLMNNSVSPITFTPTSSIPIYGRSAENIRDHRHVTSLVNRPIITDNGITMQPVIKFDEAGHKYNNTLYYVFGSEGNGTKPEGTIGAISNFIGLQGDLEWPEAVVRNLSPSLFNDSPLDGKECIGGIRFNPITLQPGQSTNYILILGLADDTDDLTAILDKYNSDTKIQRALDANKTFWNTQATKVTFESGLKGFSNWVKWIEVQPVLRKIYGCSFLPYHDYGKGGRGWRDLWQDCLSLILLQPEQSRELLVNNFGGVRIDGTNATIIGTAPGEFIADRNNIPRVWMDHGSWPYLTTKLYLDQSGDFDLLLEKQSFFKDALVRRAASHDESWSSQKGSQLKDHAGNIIQSTLLEHLLVQHLTIFFNVGEHNMMLLEGADWNDTLDMARNRGESVAFTALYGSNLISLGTLIRELKATKQINSLALLDELLLLLESTNSQKYNNINYKHQVLNHYYDQVSTTISGNRTAVDLETLALDLETKGQWIMSHIRDNEYIKLSDKTGFFNGYYNDDGLAVDGVFGEDIRMYLTGQVFTTMFGLATDEQVLASYNACRTYLKDEKTGGYKLNTPLGPNKLNFGRGFSFSYGDKENGAIFSHMVVMYMNALYRRNFVTEAYEVFSSMYDLCNDPVHSKIYPGVPEYFDLEGKGMYHYLTGSASWLFLTILTEMYGIEGSAGNLLIKPKLVAAQFDDMGIAKVGTLFANKKLSITYDNPNKLCYNNYKIIGLSINGSSVNIPLGNKSVLLSRALINELTGDITQDIIVTLG